jgi:hypothetical protein
MDGRARARARNVAERKRVFGLSPDGEFDDVVVDLSDGECN